MQTAMTMPSTEELESFKYRNLQHLAKRLGLRAPLELGRDLNSAGQRTGFGLVL